MEGIRDLLVGSRGFSGRKQGVKEYGVCLIFLSAHNPIKKGNTETMALSTDYLELF